MKRRVFIGLLGTAAVSLSAAARAQRSAMPVIGYFHFADPGYTPSPAPFLQGLKESGYIEGKNVTIEYRWAEGQYDRMPAMAAELVARKVDLIAAFGPPPARAAKNATSTIPIVFEVGNDAVEAGLVESLARPGGDATGLSILFTQLTPKRLELLCELLPEATTIALLVNPKSPTAAPSIKGAQEAAAAKAVKLLILNASTENEIDAAFASVSASKADGLIISADPFFGLTWAWSHRISCYRHHHSQRKPLAKSHSEKRPPLNVETARNSLSQWPTPATTVANRRK
jgi:putative ABC transport system substrate-binding protein